MAAPHEHWEATQAELAIHTQARITLVRKLLEEVFDGQGMLIEICATYHETSNHTHVNISGLLLHGWSVVVQWNEGEADVICFLYDVPGQPYVLYLERYPDTTESVLGATLSHFWTRIQKG